MRRSFALGALGALAAAVLAYTLTGPGVALVGSWETAIALGGRRELSLRYTFRADGAYLCALADPDGGPEAAEVQGNYRALSDRLFLSEGPDYAVDAAVYDHYRLQGDTLTLLDSSTDALAGFYPLRLTRVR